METMKDLLPFIQFLILPGFGLLWWEVRTLRSSIGKLYQHINEIEKEQTARNENTNKHIIGCANFKLREGVEGLVK